MTSKERQSFATFCARVALCLRLVYGSRKRGVTVVLNDEAPRDGGLPVMGGAFAAGGVAEVFGGHGSTMTELRLYAMHELAHCYCPDKDQGHGSAFYAGVRAVSSAVLGVDIPERIDDTAYEPEEYLRRKLKSNKGKVISPPAELRVRISHGK